MELPGLTTEEQALCDTISLQRTDIVRRADPALRIRQASMGEHAGRLVFRYVKSLGYSRIFEIGTCAGIGAAYMCAGAEAALKDPEGRVHFTGMEGVDAKTAFANETLLTITPRTDFKIFGGNFDGSFEPALAYAKPLQFVYLDGRHKRKFTLMMFNRCVEEMTEGGVILCDDLNQGPQGDAKRVMQQHERVTQFHSFAAKDAFLISSADGA